MSYRYLLSIKTKINSQVWEKMPLSFFFTQSPIADENGTTSVFLPTEISVAKRRHGAVISIIRSQRDLYSLETSAILFILYYNSITLKICRKFSDETRDFQSIVNIYFSDTHQTQHIRLRFFLSSIHFLWAFSGIAFLVFPPILFNGLDRLKTGFAERKFRV